MDLNKLVFDLDEFEHYNNYFKEYYENEQLYLYENNEKYKKALNNIKAFFKEKKDYLAFYDDYELRVICDLIIYSYYKEFQKEDDYKKHINFFSDKVIHRMSFLSGTSYCNFLRLIPEKLIKKNRIINNFMNIALELNENYSKDITKPQEISLFNLDLLERTLKLFEINYQSIFFENSENLKFIDKFLNLEENKKKIIEKELDEIFREGYRNIIILNEKYDYKKAKMYREVGIDRIKAKLKKLLKK